MSGEPKMFRINLEGRESEAITEVDFSRLGLQERRDIQEWIIANPSILGDDLLIVGKEFSDFDRTSERLDLLAVASDGKLVIIELKRDDTGSDAQWQAIKCASYLRHATANDIASMLANYGGMSETEAMGRLLQHLQDEDFTRLNHDQRIILASHRFAPEVTSAVLWLNEKAQYDLIACVQLVPYHDSQLNALFVQASTIIPLPGVDKYVVRVGDSSQNGGGTVRSSLGEKLARSIARNRGDEVTAFLRRVGDTAVNGLPDEIRPDRRSRWARTISGANRYYCMWYSRSPLNLRAMQYVLYIYPTHDLVTVAVNLEFRKRYLRNRLGYSEDEIESLAAMLRNLEMSDDVHVQNDTTWLRPQSRVTGKHLDDDFAQTVAGVLKRFVEVGTPAFEDFESDRNVAEGK